ncbi:hypothetical protein Rumal_3774 (plasmid) [Ruminococcus albus 7 = DSM 20455]|uniref:Uncharacterized protein n=1 Tax=Ruminococcus albus (strain ATCC 27210 / DSM 20455 / JCM 14654 / NCDO 2250 / 7) TaxID=697329 RepID=E6UKL2_RUMA7|nr:DUF4869 domain-containing protein [Ruminococcus albus]ADU24208.1 hypothetical protein Rumal_3774 [Ruminococcus albus 7 = DSM 20455]
MFRITVFLVADWCVPRGEIITDKIFNASACGDNCAEWLLEIGKKKDITVNLRHIMDFGEVSFDIHIQNTDQVVHSMKELIPIAGMIVR